MLTNPAGAGALDYFPCRYGQSRSVFRGPVRDLSGDYVVVLGGSPTFGKYVAKPYPDLVEAATGCPVVNLGVLNGGPDVFLSDPAVLDVAARARVAVVQISGAGAISNPYYTVHARRNDRFLAARPALISLFPEVEFTEIHFVRHLLTALKQTDGQRFAQVVRALKANWVARMQELLVHLPPRRILLWLGEASPPPHASLLEAGHGPLFVDSGMLKALNPASGLLIEAIPSAAACAEGVANMHFPLTEEALARCHPGAAVHREIAGLLAPPVAALLRKGPLARLILDQPLALAAV